MLQRGQKKQKQQQKGLFQKFIGFFESQGDKKQNSKETKMTKIDQDLKRKISIEQKFNIKLPNYYIKPQKGRVFQAFPIMFASTQANILKAYDDENYKNCQEEIGKLANTSTCSVIINHLVKVEKLKKSLEQQRGKNRQLSLSFQKTCQKKYQGLDQKQKPYNVYSDIIYLLRKDLYDSALSKIRKQLNNTDSQNLFQIAQFYGCLKKFIKHIESQNQLQAIKNSPFVLEYYLQSKQTKKFANLVNQSIIIQNKFLVQFIDKIGVKSTQKDFQSKTAVIQSNTLRKALQDINKRFDDLRLIVNVWEGSIKKLVKKQQLDFDLSLLHQKQPKLNDTKYMRTKKLYELDPMIMPAINQVGKILRNIDRNPQINYQSSYTHFGQHMIASQVNLIQKINCYNMFNSPINFTRDKPNLAFMAIQTFFEKSSILIDKIMLAIENLLFKNFQQVDTYSYPYKGINLPSKEAMIDWYLEQIRVQLPKKVYQQVSSQKIIILPNQRNGVKRESQEIQTGTSIQGKTNPGTRMLDQRPLLEVPPIENWTWTFVNEPNLSEYMRNRIHPIRKVNKQFQQAYWFETDIRCLHEQRKWPQFFSYLQKVITVLIEAVNYRQSCITNEQAKARTLIDDKQYLLSQNQRLIGRVQFFEEQERRLKQNTQASNKQKWELRDKVRALEEQLGQYSSEIVSRIEQLQDSKKRNKKKDQKSFAMLFSDLLSLTDDLKNENLTLVKFKQEWKDISQRFINNVEAYSQKYKEKFHIQGDSLVVLKRAFEQAMKAPQQYQRHFSQMKSKNDEILILKTKVDSLSSHVKILQADKLKQQLSISRQNSTVQAVKNRITQLQTQSYKKAQKIIQLQTQIGNKDIQIQNLKRQIKKFIQQVNKQREESSKTQKDRINILQFQLIQKSKTIQLLNVSLSLTQRQKQSALQEFQRKEEEFKQLLTKIEALNQVSNDKNTLARLLQNEKKTCQRISQQWQAAQKIIEKQHKFCQNLNKEKMELQEVINILQEQVRLVKQSVANSRSKKSQQFIDQTNQTLKFQISKLERQNKQLKQSLDHSTKLVKQLKSEISINQEKITKKQRQIVQNNQTIQKMKQDAQILQRKLFEKQSTNERLFQIKKINESKIKNLELLTKKKSNENDKNGQELYQRQIEQQSEVILGLRQTITQLQRQIQNQIGQRLKLSINIQRMEKNQQQQKFGKFFVGEIMDYETINKKAWLVNIIQKKSQCMFKRTKMIYRFDRLNKTNFHVYIDNQPHIVLIIKTESGKLIGAYSKGAFVAGQNSNDYTMIFSLNQLEFFEKKAECSSKVNIYDEFYIVIGNNELRIKSNEDKVFSNFGIVSGSFENKGNTVDFLLGKGKDGREDKIINYQLYSIEFQKHMPQENQ